MEEASVKVGFHYELDSGSVLGKFSSEANMDVFFYAGLYGSFFLYYRSNQTT